MDFEVTDQIVQITPNVPFPTIEDLLTTNKKNNSADAGEEERAGDISHEEEVDKMYENFAKSISIIRVSPANKRSWAIWDEDKNMARVERKVGKFDYGCKIGEHLYLDYYETLFLLEMNQLQLTYKSVLASIEMAYVLLLGEESNIKYQVYLVYAYLSRVGYYLKRHKHIEGVVYTRDFQKESIKKPRENLPKSSTESSVAVDIDDDKLLEGKVGLKDISKESDEKSLTTDTDLGDCSKVEIEPSTKCRRTDEYKSGTLSFSNDGDKKAMEFNALEKSSIEDSVESVASVATTHSTKSIISLISSGDPYYTKYQKDFEELNIIPLKTYKTVIEDDNNGSDKSDDNLRKGQNKCIEISFDLYIRNRKRSHSGKTLPLPRFHVYICKSDRKFSITDRVYRCANCQPNSVPILIVTVNEQNKLQLFTLHTS